MRTHVRFASPAFAPREPEEAQVNPGCYGRELATWLGERLRARGLDARAPFAEDWGWMVPVGMTGGALDVACGNVDDARDAWLLFVPMRRASAVARLFGGASTPPADVEALCRAIDACLRDEPSVEGIEWFAADLRGRESDHAPRPG